MTRTDLVGRNNKRSDAARQRLARALEAPTLEKARLIFSQRRRQGLGEAARRYGRYEEYKARFGDEIVEYRKGAKEKTEVTRKASALERLTQAIEAGATREEAARIYGSSIVAMSAAATRHDMRAEYEAQFGDEIRSVARERLIEAGAKGREAQSAQAVVRREALLEDAEFLAAHGEHPEQAAVRLGHGSWEALERALHRSDRGDLAARLLQNVEPSGTVRTGRLVAGGYR